MTTQNTNISQPQQDQFGTFLTLTIDNVEVIFRQIPAGEFLMGSPEDELGRWADEGPQIVKTIPEPFWLMDTPVTQDLWVAVMGENPSHFKGDRHPVETISYNDVQEFIERLNQLIEPAGFALALPTEVEWEYACRAETTGARYGDLDEIAWYYDNSENTTHPVKQKLPNKWGLYDMLGNVWEMTSSPYTNTLG